MFGHFGMFAKLRTKFFSGAALNADTEEAKKVGNESCNSLTSKEDVKMLRC